jgi:hypothetical protein
VNAVVHVGHAPSLDDRRILEHQRRLLELVEEPDASTEQHWHEVDPNLVQEPGVETLLGDVGPGDTYGSVLGDRFRLADGALQTRP